MPTLALAKDFLPDYGKLDRSLQKKVAEAIDKFGHHTEAGLHLEQMKGTRDKRTYTIRLDKNHRGIVLKPDSGDAWVLMRVLPHREADKWVARNTIDVNKATGALEVRDDIGLSEVAETMQAGAGGEATGGLFDGVGDKAFVQLGIDEGLVPVLRRIESEEQLEALAQFMPQSQADTLHGLAAGLSPEEIWAEIAPEDGAGEVDTTDVEAALRRPASQSYFYVVQGADELAKMLNEPFELWRTFLHPSQRKIAYKDRYNGSVRVTGGAGTGKTVVALHRANALADGYRDRTAGRPILFTTFTRNLARAIEDALRSLGGPELLEQVNVQNVDRLAYQIVKEHEGTNPGVATAADENEVWERIVDERGLPWSPAFLRQEWHHVVLAQDLQSRDEYFRASRAGRGVRLSRKQRAEVWKAIEAFTAELADRGLRTLLQLADAAAGYLSGRTVKPYEHVLVDEAQDLHPAQWRMLRALVAEGPDDIFLVGDTHQRIYDNKVTLSQVGINVRGRSHKLRLNYRTTFEILRWSMGLLLGERFDDLDGEEETIAGYRAQTHGPTPVAQQYDTKQAELDALVEAVRRWRDAGVELEDVGVAARSTSAANAACEALKAASIEARMMQQDDSVKDRVGVQVGTMHRMKGLEFRCVALVDVTDYQVPSSAALNDADDELDRKAVLQQERCLLYVACTRARDELRVSWTSKPSRFLEPLLDARG